MMFTVLLPGNFRSIMKEDTEKPVTKGFVCVFEFCL